MFQQSVILLYPVICRGWEEFSLTKTLVDIISGKDFTSMIFTERGVDK